MKKIVKILLNILIFYIAKINLKILVIIHNIIITSCLSTFNII